REQVAPPPRKAVHDLEGVLEVPLDGGRLGVQERSWDADGPGTILRRTGRRTGLCGPGGRPGRGCTRGVHERRSRPDRAEVGRTGRERLRCLRVVLLRAMRAARRSRMNRATSAAKSAMVCWWPAR